MTTQSDSLHVMVLATAELAAPTLDALVAVPWIDQVTVVSQPDRPQGRRRKLAPSPVRARAEALGLEVLTPEKVGAPESVAALAALNADVMAVFAYGQYLPRSVVTLPRLGAINIHPSLLPRWRGASPIQHTLLHGDPVAGVSIIGVAEEMEWGRAPKGLGKGGQPHNWRSARIGCMGDQGGVDSGGGLVAYIACNPCPLVSGFLCGFDELEHVTGCMG